MLCCARPNALCSCGAVQVQLQLGVKKRILAVDEYPLRCKLAFHEVCLLVLVCMRL